MDWIKVTPETMPPEGKRVILTTVNADGSKTTDVAIVHGNGVQLLLPGCHPCPLSDDETNIIITHYMEFPEPAED